MNLTEDMLDAAMKKAIEAGLLPRQAYRQDMAMNRELIRAILQAALNARGSSGAVMRWTAHGCFANMQRIARP